MKEIKFRGKRLDNGEWVVGLIWLKKPRSEKVFISYFPDDDDSEDVVVVDSRTIGQYTGLKDKNGVEIYVGDVLRGTQYITTTLPSENRGIVRFSERNTMYYFDEGSGKHSVFMQSLGSSVYNFEIISNIHDNPELLDTKKSS